MKGSASSSLLTTLPPKSGVAVKTAAVPAARTGPIRVAGAASRPTSAASRTVSTTAASSPSSRSAQGSPMPSASANRPIRTGGRSTQ